MLTVWDALSHGRTFMDPLEPHDAARMSPSNAQVFEGALEVVEAVHTAGA